MLNQQQIRESITRAFEEWQIYGKRVLFILPDNTRTAPIAQIYPVIYQLLHKHTPTVDSLIALGTHPPLNDREICHRIGIRGNSWWQQYPKARFFNHDWNDPEQLITIGTLSEELVTKLSEGRLTQAVPVTVNRLIQHYEMLVVIGPVFPHEVVGFSGGNKYFFPGIAGPEIIDLFHWLGALITNWMINGQKYTPVRAIVDAAAQLIPAERKCISLVVAEDSSGKREGLAGMFTGTPEEAWSQSANLSARLNVIYVDKPFRRVLAQAPEMYTDLWTGGKCMYKLEPVVADGGELIIYAPHISEVSPVHGKLLLQIGYHVRDYFLKQWDQFKDYPGGILAHSTHIKGAGEFVDGIEQPRIKVSLATGIPEEICRKINLGYLNPDSIKVDDLRNRDDVLYVPKAGEILYRLKNN
jgi:nickel-dependent lactate racemase